MSEPESMQRSSADPIITARDVWRVYHIGDVEIPALRGLNLEVQPGEFIALRGRSGSGKTTLLNCLGGLDSATSGQVRVAGQDLSSMNETALTRWRRRTIGLIFQSFGLLPSLTAYENVELILRIAGMSYAERDQRSRKVLETVGLADRMTHHPYHLSGGQQQRVAIARALASHPRLLLADEPTGELDSATSAEILSLFRQLVDSEGLTLLMVTHNPQVDDYADRLLFLKDGQIVEETRGRENIRV